MFRNFAIRGLTIGAVAAVLTGTAAFAQQMPSVADGASRAGVVNPAYVYPDFALWDPANWTGVSSKVAPITAWIAAHQPGGGDYVVPPRYHGIASFVGRPDYDWKTESVSDQAIVAPLARLGLQVDVREGGGIGIFVAPKKVLADKGSRVPVLVVPYVLDRIDPFWAMHTLVHFRRYNELCARRGDFIILYSVTDRASAARASPFGMIDMAVDGYRADYRKLYLDVSALEANHARIGDVPGLDWTDDAGHRTDPDGGIGHLGPIPFLNVAGRWQARPMPGINIATAHPANLRFDGQRIVHGILGQRIIEGAAFVARHGKDSDPATAADLAAMGVELGEHDHDGDRWLMVTSKGAAASGRRLPLVLLLSETNHYDDYAIGQAYASYRDYFRLAAQGELNLLIFSRETPETMDEAYAIVKEAERRYPIDPSRVYVTGHSHNGHLAREFAYRHPDMVAAVAPLGNASGLAAPAYSHEAVVADDARIAAWSRIDMPNITIGAASEVTSPHSMPSSILNDYDLFIEAWQRRLRAARAPMESRDEIMAAERSDDYVTRLFGLPNDGSALQVIDGVEHYVIDVRNVDGRTHLRIVGVDNMIHMPEPTMTMLAWTFMRRFARDQRTGRVVELY